MNTCSKCGREIPDGYGELCTKCFASREGSRSDVRISDVVGRERERTPTTEADSCAVEREESDSAACPFCDSNPFQQLDECSSYHAFCYKQSRRRQPAVAGERLTLNAKLTP